MHPFSEDAVVFSKKKILDPENMKKTTLKVAHNQPQTSFFLYWPGCPNGPKTEIPYPWVYRLGIWVYYMN